MSGVYRVVAGTGLCQKVTGEVVTRQGGPDHAGIPAAPGDGLDPVSWAAVCESTAAAHRGDAHAHVTPLLRVAELLGRKPSAGDLHALAERFYPAFAKLIRGDSSQLENTLLTVFALANAQRKVSGGDAVVMGSAALGVLLDNPESELTTMRPHLAAWWQRNAAEFGMDATQ